MNRPRFVPISSPTRRWPLLAMLALLGSAACDAGPTGPGSGAPAVLVGTVSLSGPGGVDASGIRVSVQGDGTEDITDAAGDFRVESWSAGGAVALQFAGPTVQAQITVSGVQPGSVTQLSVSLTDSTSASVDSVSSGPHSEFEGPAAFVDVRGDAPARVLTLAVGTDTNATHIEVEEATTTIDVEGDLVTFARILARAQAGRPFRVEGDARSDGERRLAVDLKAEVDEDQGSEDGDDFDDDEDFEGWVRTLAVSGEAPQRTARVALAKDGRTYTVDIMESSTEFHAEGDIHSFTALLDAIGAGASVKIEGLGAAGSDGVHEATLIKVERENDSDDGDDDDDRDVDFDGNVTAHALSTVEGIRVLRVTVVDDDESAVVDLVEGATVFEADGDYTSFSATLAALDAGVTLEVDGEGDRDSDGVIVAARIEVERDD